jgi:hypothetical protein
MRAKLWLYRGHARRRRIRALTDREKSVDPLQRLLAIEEIKQLKARYFRFMDTKDWEGLETLFTTDATADYSRESAADEGRKVSGAGAIAAYIRASVEHVETVHHGHMPEIEIVDAEHASAIWAMEDVLRWPPGGQISAMRGYGHYHESYRKVGGRWLIESLRLTRLRTDVG